MDQVKTLFAAAAITSVLIGSFATGAAINKRSAAPTDSQVTEQSLGQISETTANPGAVDRGTPRQDTFIGELDGGFAGRESEEREHSERENRDRRSSEREDRNREGSERGGRSGDGDEGFGDDDDND